MKLQLINIKLLKHKKNPNIFYSQRSVSNHRTQPVHIGHKLRQVWVREGPGLALGPCLFTGVHVVDPVVELEHVARARSLRDVPWVPLAFGRMNGVV